MANKTIIAFDLYGTLLSTASIAKELASHFGEEKAKSIAAQWRRYQLEYTFRLNSMSTYSQYVRAQGRPADIVRCLQTILRCHTCVSPSRFTRTKAITFGRGYEESDESI